VAAYLSITDMQTTLAELRAMLPVRCCSVGLFLRTLEPLIQADDKDKDSRASKNFGGDAKSRDG